MTGVIATIPRFQFSSAQGNPLVNGKLYTYLAGTTTPATTFQDQALTIANENPIQLDSRGECVLWLDPAKSYKLVLKNFLGVTQWTQDNVVGALASNRERPIETELQVAGESQKLFTLKQLTYTPGINSLKVYVDGFRLSGAEYAETAPDAVTFGAGLRAGQEVLFETGSGVNSQSMVDAAMIPFGAGSVASRLSEIVSAKIKGAKGDGIADDTAPLIDFFAAAQNGYIPEGTYRVNAATLNVLTPKIISGAGRGRTVLVFENMAGVKDAISVLSASFPNGGAFVLIDMTIAVKGAHARSGVVTQKGSAVFDLSPSFLFERLEFRGTVEDATLGNLYDYGFIRTIDMGDSTGSTIRDVNVFGSYDYRLDPALTNSTHAAFYFSGQQGGGGVLMPRIDHCFAHYVGTAVEFGYQVSQPSIGGGSQFHRTYRGIYSPNPYNSGSDYGVSEFIARDININSQLRCVSFEKTAFVDMNTIRATRANGGFNHALDWYGFYFDQVDELKLSGLRAYNEGVAYTNTHIGIQISNSDYPKLRDFHVYSGVAGGISKGVVLKDNRFAVVGGPSFRNANVAMSFETVSGSAAPEVSIDSQPMFGPGVVTQYAYGAGIQRDLIVMPADRDSYETADLSATAISAAGSVTLVRGVDNQVKRYNFTTGAGAYVYDITLSNTNAEPGDKFVFHIISSATTPTINIKDATGAAQVTLNNGAAKKYRVEMVFGTAWRCIGATESIA